MEYKNVLMLVVGLVLGILMLVGLFLKVGKNGSFKKGKRIVDVGDVNHDPYFRRQLFIYRVLNVMFGAFAIVSVVTSCYMISRPYTAEVTQQELHSRDIILCMDVSTSVDQLNQSLIIKLEDTVKALEGERVGIVIFNTSPVLVSPLTDDYEFIIEQLEILERGLDNRLNNNYNYYDDDVISSLAYIQGGTIVGYEERGTSLIGDGLASTASYFDYADPDRTKIVIFTTDNELGGTPIFSLEEAAKLCKSKGIVTYGVGTKEMYSDSTIEMSECMRLTGGEFYLEEESGSMDDIVENIEATAGTLITGSKKVIEHDYVQVPFAILLISIIGMCVTRKMLKE